MSTFNVKPIQNVTRRLLQHYHKGEASRDEILHEIIRYQNSTMEQAERMFETFEMTGLDTCYSSYKYSIPKFAEIRGWLSRDRAKELSTGKK